MNDKAAPPTGPAGPAGPDQPERQAPKPKRVRDMVLSMAVILAGAFGLFLLVPNDPSKDPVRPIDYRVEALSAGRAAPYELLVPDGLSEEWRATSVRYRHESEYGAYWRLGYMDPDNEYVGLGQADRAPGAFIADFTHGAKDTGETVTVDGEDWARYSGPKYNALVRQTPAVTVIVAGTAPADHLQHFAGSLAPPPAP